MRAHRRKWAVLPALLLALVLGSCAAPAASSASKRDNIPFEEGQLYAAAYLGYQEPEDLDYYVEQYLDIDQLPVCYLSGGDYYLVIPRYEGTALSLYQNNLESGQSFLVYEDPDCRPFLLQCNVSDIFADATLRLTYGDSTVEFSPFISLKDGSVDIGPGLDLTKPATP
jgi:hypothetical protein